jgi:FkbM family methyltransferase
MNGILFDNVQVKLAPKSARLTGAWTGRTPNGVPIAHDSKLIKAVYSHLKTIENPIMLDVGASVGSFALLGVALPTLWVTAFEPNPAARRLLAINAQLNGLERRVKILPYALMDKDGTATLKVPAEPHRVGMATLGKPKRFSGGKGVKVATHRMDGLDMGPVHFIKIDAEGADLFVLRGGERFIKRHRPVILVACSFCAAGSGSSRGTARLSWWKLTSRTPFSSTTSRPPSAIC